MDESSYTKVLGVLVAAALLIGIALVADKLQQTGYAITGTTGTGTASTTINAEVSIKLNDNAINLGTLSVGNSSQPTSDFFILENDGSVAANVTIKATNLWNSSTTCTVLPCYQYQYMANDSETGSGNFNVSDGTSWIQYNVSGSGNYHWVNATGAAGQFVQNFNYVDSADTLNVFINATAPQDQAPGARSSTVTFTASSFE